jgi:predicted subunit of tRNA(5-methylaminomethyl-2-thiouridylate) methyltransferase
MSKKKVAVLFTGGRDSSLVASLEALQGNEVHLLTCNSGIGIGSELSQIRVEQLMERFPENIVGRTYLPTYGLFRSVAIENLEDDFRRWGINLVLLGDKLAIHAAATVYCIQNGIDRIVDGCVGYQEDLAEQKEVALELLKDFEKKYGIEYESPIYNYGSKDDVKYALLTLGLSSKSLEGVSIFGDAFSEPTEKQVEEYILDKLPICHKHVELLTNTAKVVERTRYNPEILTV